MGVILGLWGVGGEKVRVGLVYDPAYLRHGADWHVECPERLTRTLTVLEKKGIRGKLKEIKPRAATAAEVALVHSPGYIERVEAFCRAGGGHLDPDTYANAASYEVALLAVGGVLSAIDAVVRGEVARAFALVRPPGHHALPDRAMGFCLFNNVAVAARYAAQKYGLGRILVVDWDYHHGNGTEAVFYEDRGVLYFSTHSATGYPGTGWVERVGEGAGAGFNINVPLPNVAGDGDMRYVFEQLLLPVAAEYQPELVLVSAGQDGYRGDPIAGMALTPAGYGEMAALVRWVADRYAGGRLVGALEGGYDLEGLGECVAAIVTAWLADVAALEERVREKIPDARVHPQVAAAVAAVKEAHRPFWASFQS